MQQAPQLTLVQTRRGPLNEDVFSAQPCPEEKPLHPGVQELTEQIHRLLLQVGAPPRDARPAGGLRPARCSEAWARPACSARTGACSPHCPVGWFGRSLCWALDRRAHLQIAQFGAAPALRFWGICL